MCGAVDGIARKRAPRTAARIQVEGIVQGVGFRPFIFRLAEEHGLAGTVSNTTQGVLIEVEGAADHVAAFYEDISAKQPPQAHVLAKDLRYVEPRGYTDFQIRASAADQPRIVPVSPDLGLCADCLRELLDPTDRRYRYPFINCTNCGPRFTIIRDVPYDRDKTTMAGFEMCGDCRAEYEDPASRRFHAQPNACPVCGPQVRLVGPDGEPMGADEPLEAAQRMLLDGQTIAVKGIGGYHLACDARNAEAVAALRRRKVREDKPFALMVRDGETAGRLCVLGPQELALLESVQRPVVLARRRDGAAVAPGVAPRGNKHLGVMLPYTPLHHLLLCEDLDALVMTSGNLSDEPIAFEDEEALTRLGRIADAFLVHNRPIHIRTDDSVTRVVARREQLVRRSRGYAPAPLRLAHSFEHRILACGAQLKNTFCLTRGRDVFLSHHIGDLENLETLASFEQGVEHFKRLFDVAPDLVAHDLHPRYLSTQYALGLADVPKVGVQHHHAHIAACLADNNTECPTIGVALDGTGYGADGAIWGGEFLVVDGALYERAAHLEYVPMPGGEQAVREPWRMAFSYLHQVYGPETGSLGVCLVDALDKQTRDLLTSALESGVNSPPTSSAGRLFDAVSALLGICRRSNYEGQAAMELEMAADEDATEAYPFEIVGASGPLKIRVDGLIRGIVEDLRSEKPVGAIAGRFHQTWAEIILAACTRIRARTGIDHVALSGGVFQNVLLLERTRPLLSGAGFRVITHHRVPPNDGGICLGQAVIAERLAAA